MIRESPEQFLKEKSSGQGGGTHPYPAFFGHSEFSAFLKGFYFLFKKIFMTSTSQTNEIFMGTRSQVLPKTECSLFCCCFCLVLHVSS